MGINFYDYVSKYDFVPFAQLLSSDDFKVGTASKAKIISPYLKEAYQAISDVKIEFKPEALKKGKTVLKFKLQKAHQYASDPDGYLRYKLTTIAGQEFVSNHKKEVEHDLGIKKYGDIIEIVFSKNLMETVQFIDFYFKDNTDAWLDLKGNVPDSWEHCGRVTIGTGSTCYCNRDFTEEEIKTIVKELKENTFYIAEDPATKKNKEYPITNLPYHSINKLFYFEKNMPDDHKTYTAFTKALNNTLKEFEINTCLRKIHFIAQIYWETGYFSATKEKNADTQSYYPYIGRGFMQLTGTKKGEPGLEDSRTHNATAYLGYKKYSKLDVIKNLDLISNSIYHSATSGGWFWKYGKVLDDGSILDINTEADKDNLSRVSVLVNGGTNGRDERIKAYNILKKVMNYEKCSKKK